METTSSTEITKNLQNDEKLTAKSLIENTKEKNSVVIQVADMSINKNARVYKIEESDSVTVFIFCYPEDIELEDGILYKISHTDDTDWTVTVTKTNDTDEVTSI